jgi:hypothetical protein
MTFKFRIISFLFRWDWKKHRFIFCTVSRLKTFKFHFIETTFHDILKLSFTSNLKLLNRLKSNKNAFLWNSTQGNLSIFQIKIRTHDYQAQRLAVEKLSRRIHLKKASNEDFSLNINSKIFRRNFLFCFNETSKLDPSLFFFIASWFVLQISIRPPSNFCSYAYIAPLYVSMSSTEYKKSTSQVPTDHSIMKVYTRTNGRTDGGTYFRSGSASVPRIYIFTGWTWQRLPTQVGRQNKFWSQKWTATRLPVQDGATT